MNARRTLPMLLLLLPLLAAPSAARAEGWSWLRSENSSVREGNQKLKAGDKKGALAAYDRAAHELPSVGGVHLDRGLALLSQDKLSQARDALQLATQPPAPSAVRADAYYDLGIGFYKEADARAGEKKHDEAQKLFRQAADAFKHALRMRPGDRNAAWNYELAARRIREQQEKQKQQEQKDKDKDKDKQQDQKDQQQNQQDKDKDKQQQQDQQQGDKDKQQQDKDKQQQDQQQQKKQPQPSKPEQQQPKRQPQQKAPRPEVERALDALQDSEQNLQRLKAMNRAAAEQRKPEKDW